MSDPLWTSNLRILYNTHRLLEFWPSKFHSYEERVNAISRFTIYTAIMLSLHKNDTLYIALGIALLALIYILSKNKKKSKHSVNVTEFPELTDKIDAKCQEPSPNNPFANTLISDLPTPYNEFEVKDPACSSYKIDKKIKDAFFHDFKPGQNPLDIYDKTHNQRQFHSMPNTTIPNDQGAFAEWLYKKDIVCKQQNEVCTGFESGGPGSGGGVP
jgi:hypothetical protein